MSERAWRQLLREAIVEAPRTAAQDAIVRLAISMWCADPQSALSPEEREPWQKRLEPDPEGRVAPFTPEERAALRAPLLAYVQCYRPSIAEIVAHQFEEKE